MKKILVFFLVLTVGNGLFAANVANPRAPKSRDAAEIDPRVVIIKENNKRHNYFSISLVGEYYDMLNEMFKSSASIEAGWLYDFNEDVFMELGMSWTILGPAVNDASIFLGVGFKPMNYYYPEIFFASQFLKTGAVSGAASDVKIGLRNNVKIDGTIGTKIFFDVGAKVKDGDFANFTAYLALGVGLDI